MLILGMGAMLSCVRMTAFVLRMTAFSEQPVDKDFRTACGQVCALRSGPLNTWSQWLSCSSHTEDSETHNRDQRNRLACTMVSGQELGHERQSFQPVHWFQASVLMVLMHAVL